MALKPLDPSLYKEIASPEGSAAPSAPALRPLGFSPTEVEEMPSYANGLSPEAPINRSPVDAMDRAKLGIGNAAGGVKFLKSKFEDAKLDRSGNVLVKDKGLWHRVDPDGWGDGDAWERTKEIAKDFLDLGDVAIGVAGTVIGAAKGAGTGAVAGGAAGSVVPGAGNLAGAVGGGAAGAIAGAAGGGAIAAGLRTSLGRLVGTYDATPMEQLYDIGVETLLSAGGEAVALGAKPTWQMLKKAVGNVSKDASNFGKENLASFLSRQMQEPMESIRAGLDDRLVLDTAERAAKSAGPVPSDVVKANLQRANNNLLIETAPKLRQGLNRAWRDDAAKVVEAAGDDFAFSTGAIARETQEAMSQSGILKPRIRMKGNEQTIVGYDLRSPEEVARLFDIPTDQVPRMFGEHSRAAMAQINEVLGSFSTNKTLKGKLGAKKAIEVRKSLNDAFEGLFGNDVPPKVRAHVTEVKEMLNTAIDTRFGVSTAADGSRFANSEMGARFLELNHNFKTRKDAVDMIVDAVDKGRTQSGVIDNMVEQLVGKQAKNVNFKDQAKAVFDILGKEEGERVLSTMWRQHHAKAFVSFSNKAGGGNSAETLIRGMGFGTYSNPRAVRKGIQYSNQVLNLFRKTSPEARSALLKNDEALSGVLKTAEEGFMTEDQLLEQTLKQAGVK
jgi:hypothetical protein